MKRNGHVLALVALLVSACGGDTQLPEPTGRASIRAINAIAGSSEVSFLIEERPIANISFQNGSNTDRYDDFTYIFNFEVLFAGDATVTRFASREIDFTPDADYTLLLSGSVAAPTITLWESTERTFDSGATIFQARFAHTANTWGPIDVYFAPEGTAPVPGEQAATLAVGEISEPLDFEGGDYVVTVTVPRNPGENIDPADILYTSSPATVTALSEIIVTTFDGDANDVAPAVVRGLLDTGTAVNFPDPSFPGTVQFLHSALDLGSADIYDDEALTSQVVSDHQFMQLTADIPADTGNNTFRYTPAGSTAAVNVEATVATTTGRHRRVVAYGTGGTYENTNFVPDRAPVETAVKINTFHASDNFDLLSIFAVEPGASIDGELPFRLGLSRALVANPVLLAPGEYDLIVVETGESDILAGPLTVDVELGDVLDLVIFDTADPAVLDLRLLD